MLAAVLLFVAGHTVVLCAGILYQPCVVPKVLSSTPQVMFVACGALLGGNPDCACAADDAHTKIES
jgi:hypothetical protein